MLDWVLDAHWHSLHMKQKTIRKTKNQVSSPKSGKHEGVLRLHPRGFGFVESEDEVDTVFVPPVHINGVLDGDDVVASWRASATGERNTTKLTVITRNRRYVVGTVVKQNMIELDPGIGSGIIECVGAVTQGDVVVARLTSQPGDAMTSEFVRSLGAGNEALTSRILNRHLFPEVHTEEVEAEATKLAAGSQLRPSRNKSLPDQRRDLSGQFVVTIDADHSRDLDDALAVQVDDDGHLRVWVHIADVGQYVKPGSKLDVAAQGVPTSVYLPEHVRPMLPALLSEQALSLLPGVLRDVMTVELRIAPEGTMTAVDVYESRIRSRRRLSYDTVAGIIDGSLVTGNPARGANADTLEDETLSTVKLLHAAASRIGFVRKSRGGVDSNRVAIELPFSEGDKAASAHMLVERLMVAANESVATWLIERGAPALFRVHPALDEEQTSELEEIARALGITAHLPRPLTPAAFSAFTEQLEGHPKAAAIWDAIMGMMGRAGYSPANTGHFGLGSVGYLHFTSPLRRYADLVVHRIVKNYLEGVRSGKQRDWGIPNLDELSRHIDRTNRRADAAEREATRALELSAIATGQSTDGVVVSVSSRGVVVATPLSPVAALVPARKLPKGWLLDESIRRVRSTSGTSVGVGDRVKIKTDRIEPLTGRFEARFVSSSRGSSSQNSTRKDASPTKNPTGTRSSSRQSSAGRTQDQPKLKRSVNPKPATAGPASEVTDQPATPGGHTQSRTRQNGTSRNRRDRDTDKRRTDKRGTDKRGTESAGISAIGRSGSDGTAPATQETAVKIGKSKTEKRSSGRKPASKRTQKAGPGSSRTQKVADRQSGASNSAGVQDGEKKKSGTDTPTGRRRSRRRNRGSDSSE